MILDIKTAYRNYSEWQFDKKWSVDTRAMASDPEEISSPLHSSAEPYEATTPRQFKRIMKRVQQHIVLPETFIDIGCGKGRTLMLAAQYGFKRIIGVEFDAALAEIAAANIKSFKKSFPKCGEINVVCEDAGTYTFPDENSLIYFFNPFSEIVMSSVLTNLIFSAKVNKVRHIVYKNPKCEALFNDDQRFSTISRDIGYSIYEMKF